MGDTNKVMKPTMFKDIPKKYRDGIIPVHVFFKEKYKADGTYDKMKARLVANGDKMNPDLIGETFSPTVNPISVMTQINVAAVTKQFISAYDIKGAFLLTPMRNNNRIFIRLPSDIVVHWIKLYPEHTKYVNAQGQMYMELDKYLYGLPEAPHEFNNLLDQRLQSIGFIPSKADPCLYVKQVPQGRLIASTHVDDILLTTPTLEDRQWFEKEMKKHFELICQYDNISYLGMTVSRNPTTGDIQVSQEGFIKDLLKKYGCENISKPPKTPATDKLTIEEVKDESVLCSQKKFLSLIMSLMYLARFTRPDILMSTTFLATRSSKPTELDMQKAMRIVRYLSGTVSKGIHFRSDKKINPTIYADAGHCVHADGRGHGGIVITLGSGPIHVRSYKLKSTTRSSSESELSVLEEASTYVQWYIALLQSFGITNVKPLTIYQDNKSTIIMAVQGGSFKRTKHLICKESYVKERLLNGDITVKYLPTKSMPADMLTKPLSQFMLEHCLSSLHVF